MTNAQTQTKEVLTRHASVQCETEDDTVVEDTKQDEEEDILAQRPLPSMVMSTPMAKLPRRPVMTPASVARPASPDLDKTPTSAQETPVVRKEGLPPTPPPFGQWDEESPIKRQVAPLISLEELDVSF